MPLSAISLACQSAAFVAEDQEVSRDAARRAGMQRPGAASTSSGRHGSQPAARAPAALMCTRML